MTPAAGKVVVVTGGASGIGREVAKSFVADGASVVLGDRARADEVAHELGPHARAATVDVTDEAGVEGLMELAVREFGTIDVAVNSAGVGWLTPITEHTVDDWRTVVEVCLTGTFLSIKHAARLMRARRSGGVILNLASINARQPAEGMAAYCSAKAGVEMLTKVAAMELAPHGIRVVGIGPGLIDTPLTEVLTGHEPARAAYVHNTPLGRVGTTSDVAAAARFLSGDEASWITGETLYVDGGALTREYPRLPGILGMSDG